MITIFAQMNHPQAGYAGDQKAAQGLTNEFYEVKELHVGQSSSKVTLVDNPVVYNTVNFDFFIRKDGAALETIEDSKLFWMDHPVVRNPYRRRQ